MSNCIDFHNPEVFFGADEIDLATYRERCERLKGLNPMVACQHQFQSEEDRNFAWFLARNSRFIEDGVVIRFGEGYSSHTWRDFEYTVKYLLGPYMRRLKAHTFKLSDEFDGFSSRFSETVVFKPASNAT